MWLQQSRFVDNSFLKCSILSLRIVLGSALLYRYASVYPGYLRGRQWGRAHPLPVLWFLQLYMVKGHKHGLPHVDERHIDGHNSGQLHDASSMSPSDFRMAVSQTRLIRRWLGDLRIWYLVPVMVPTVMHIISNAFLSLMSSFTFSQTRTILF